MNGLGMNLAKKIRALARFLFGSSAHAFGTLSVLLVLLLAIVPAKDRFREWLWYQNQYRRLIQDRPDATALEKRFQPGIQQIWLPDLSVTDRCPTCHVAMKEASLAGVSQPFRPHPPMPHSPTEFGCTVCHRGQGVATTVEEAHRSTKAWEQPILPERFLEAACGQCHEQPLPGTPQLNSGRSLLTRYGCVNCHKLVTPGGSTMQGADRPPSLRHISQKTTREWIYSWIRDPQAWASTATMPNFGLSDDDARDISGFIASQSTGDQLASMPGSVAGDSAIEQGLKLYGESFCASCHAMRNASGTIVGGNIGPELTRVGSKVKPEWLAAWLKNPAQYLPGTAMPHFRLSPKDLEQLTAFLGSKKDDPLLANVHLDPATPSQIAHGRKLVNEKGCAACHEINGVDHPENFAPDLTTVGSLPLARVLFAPGIARSLPDYLEAKIRNPRAFGKEMKMPRNDFSDAQVTSLVVALLAQTDRTEVRGKTQPAFTRNEFQPTGRAGQLFSDLHCLSCHSVNGTGGELAPDLSWEGSSVRRAWLVDFLKNPNTLRPALIRRMPRFQLSENEANLLADYILSVFQTPAFVSDEIDESKLTTTEASRGKSLYYGKYACNSCHVLDAENDKGYIGPVLTQVGLRLNATWVFHWLKNAQALRPGSLEIDWNMNDDDARAITAFLMQQKSSRKPGGPK